MLDLTDCLAWLTDISTGPGHRSRICYPFYVMEFASLFSTCVECFEYMKTAQNYDEAIEILLVKLDLEKTRLLIWGNAVGILKKSDEGRAKELGDPSIGNLIESCLERIKSL